MRPDLSQKNSFLDVNMSKELDQGSRGVSDSSRVP